MPDEPGRLLVVDDNEANRDMLSRRLSRRGHRVTAAEDGQRALELLGQEEFDVVLLDIMMPGIDGLEVLERLRRDRAPSDLPVIMVTAKTESEDIVKALKLGANDYVTKPLDFPVVLARVQSQLMLKRARDALHAAHARMKRDLIAAAKAQQDLLPRELPELEGVRFAWHYEPCDELAGDVLNVIPLDADHVAIYVLDVCGHGVRSSLLSVAMTHTLSRKADPSSIITVPGGESGAYEIAEPAAVAQRLSSLFPMEENGMLFAALVYGVIDRRSRRFTYTCAAGPGPLWVRADGDANRRDQPGLPIGISTENASDEDSYGSAVLELRPGDRVFLYSDGMIEERSPEGEEFGQERLSASLAGSRARPLEESLREAVAQLRDWVGGAGFKDDLSVVALEVTE